MTQLNDELLAFSNLNDELLAFLNVYLGKIINQILFLDCCMPKIGHEIEFKNRFQISLTLTNWSILLLFFSNETSCSIAMQLPT